MCISCHVILVSKPPHVILTLDLLRAEMPFLTLLSMVVATEDAIARDIPPTLWCLDDSYSFHMYIHVHLLMYTNTWNVKHTHRYKELAENLKVSTTRSHFFKILERTEYTVCINYSTIYHCIVQTML